MNIQLLPARVADLKHLCEKTSTPKFLGFLTPDELSVALKCLNNSERYDFFGGYEGAERVLLGFMPDWCEELVYPITALSFKYRECDKLTHRDFLGSLMALGINRETVGDILVSDGRAVVFLLNETAKFVLSQISKIGRVGVTVSEGFTEPLPNAGKKQEMSVTVASLRLDCVVSALCSLSRKEASQKIADGLVFVNSICIQKPTHTLASGSKVTVRQKGRFEIISGEEHSKKGRIILRYSKYV